jgi:hypothetical protein
MVLKNQTRGKKKDSELLIFRSNQSQIEKINGEWRSRIKKIVV